MKWNMGVRYALHNLQHIQSRLGPVCRGCGLYKRDTAVSERKGQKKEHGWVLVSKSLTLPPSLPIDDVPSEKKYSLGL